jgi:hypothetical protein
MLAQAGRRKARAVREGRIKLVAGSYERLPDLHGPFDRIMAVNALQFSGQSVAVLANLLALMADAGFTDITTDELPLEPA